MFRVAALLWKHGDDSLEVCVESNHQFKFRRDVRTNIRSSNEQTVIGMVSFDDKRSSEEIMLDFAYTYPAAKTSGNNVKEGYHFASYSGEFELTIPVAFINYFSNSQNRG